MKPTNFDDYLDEQLQNPDFAERFRNAGEAWDVSLQIARLREEAGLSQKDLAIRIDTTQQQVSRLESPAYEGHSLSMLRRVAAALNLRVRVVLERIPAEKKSAKRFAKSKSEKSVTGKSSGSRMTQRKNTRRQATRG